MQTVDNHVLCTAILIDVYDIMDLLNVAIVINGMLNKWNEIKWKGCLGGFLFGSSKSIDVFGSSVKFLIIHYYPVFV
jgi:hypothetical protein